MRHPGAAGRGLRPGPRHRDREQALARQLLRSLHGGMLLLADRNFYGYQLWNAAAGTGADLLWRVKASLHLPVVAELPDGSFLAHVNDPAAVLARTRRNATAAAAAASSAPRPGRCPASPSGSSSSG